MTTATPLGGKFAVVTGGARGIGAAVAELLAADGARVLSIDREAPAAPDTDRAIVPYACDLASDAECEAAGDRITAEFGTPDIVVNNASLAMLGSIETIVVDDWRRTLDVNVLGYVRILKAFAPGMIARGSGHFVNVASSMGIVPPAEGARIMMPYVASKAAEIGLSQAMAASLRPYGVGVSVFLPAVTDTGSDPAPGAASPEAAAQLQAVARSGVSPRATARALVDGIGSGSFLVTNEEGLQDRLAGLVENWLKTGVRP